MIGMYCPKCGAPMRGITVGWFTGGDRGDILG